MVKLTKAIIKKHGISKKAWQVARANQRKRTTQVRRTFRKSANRLRTQIKKTSRKQRRHTMARRKKNTRGKSKGLTANKTGKLIAMGVGAGLVGAAGAAVKNFLPQASQLTDELIGGIGGVVLDQTTKGIPKQIGQGMIVASIAGFTGNLTNTLIGGLGGAGTGNAGTGFTIQS